MALSANERKKQFIARGGVNKSGKSGKTSKWDVGEFIAIDGEGENTGVTEKYEIEGRHYEAKEHIYTLLAASTGESLFNNGQRLPASECIDFLCELSCEYPKAIFVIFAGGYDINHMLMWGFERVELQRISRGENFEYQRGETHYSIEYRARKSLTIRRGLKFYQDKHGKWQKKWQDKIILWDVFGYFQESFVKVMGKWLGEDYKHYDLIKRMKEKRGDFANVAQSDINNYNAAELESLVAIMDKLRDAVRGLDLVCRRWDGAGSVAAALMQKHHIKESKQDTPKEIIDAVRTAYAGGRIEVCKIGSHSEKVYDYDINSAYPTVMAGLPSMCAGTWQHGEGLPPPGLTLCHVSFRFHDDMPFYPLFYRTDRMQISFPSSGEGIYWYPEYEAALQCPGEINVIGWWHFEPANSAKPFHWIEDYYETRAQWVQNPTEDWQRGGEKIIKLGLNSLYGKTAQQLGGRDGKPPVYHQMEWAGYITSATRARLYLAAIKRPQAIIGFATDGIFTTDPLPLEISTTKQMGAWSLKIFDGLTIAMAGVYWWHLKEHAYEHFSRGFDKDSMRTPSFVLQAWRAGATSIDIPMQRLIGMGSACASATLWKMRGRFTQGVRSLRLDGQSHKRTACNVRTKKPHKQLIALQPNINLDYEMGLQECSCPYPLKWMEAEVSADYLKELELIKEMGDSENI